MRLVYVILITAKLDNYLGNKIIQLLLLVMMILKSIRLL